MNQRAIDMLIYEALRRQMLGEIASVSKDYRAVQEFCNRYLSRCPTSRKRDMMCELRDWFERSDAMDACRREQLLKRDKEFLRALRIASS